MTVSLKSHFFRNELYLARFHAAGASGLIFITGNLSLEFMTKSTNCLQYDVMVITDIVQMKLKTRTHAYTPVSRNAS